jgi:Arc/MetJ family transcription regulator
MVHMRTNIDLDDELLKEASRYSASRSKRGLIHEALATFVRVKAEEKRRATYRERLEKVRARVAGAGRGVDSRDLVRSDRDSR